MSRRSIDDATPEEWNAVNRKFIKMAGSAQEAMDKIQSIDAEKALQELVDIGQEHGLYDIKHNPLIRIPYKYNEAALIDEFRAYVDATYSQHYSRSRFQATEMIIDNGHGTGFCIGNVLKYAQRYGNKGTPDDARKDLMKVLHYALIQLYIHDQENS